MNQFLEIVAQNPNGVLIALAALFLAVIAILILTGRKKEARLLVYKLILEAEKAFIDERGAGREKYDLVVKRVYEAMPFILRLVVSRDQVDEWIEEGVYKLKDITDNGVIDGSAEEVTEDGEA